MGKTSILLASLGLLILLMSLSNLVLVADGSRGHWGYLIAISNDDSEVAVTTPAASGEAGAPAAQPAVQTTPAAAEDINIPLPAQDGSQASAPTIDKPGAALPTQTETYPPERVRIPSISLDAPIVTVQSRLVQLDGQTFAQWLPPDLFAAGWHVSSSPLGRLGNTVLNGHNNIFGGVFDKLHNVVVGDRIYITSGDVTFVYEVTNAMILKEKYQSLETRLANAQWLQPSQDERLTLVTCWPPYNNTHRVIVVARPVERISSHSLTNQ